MASERQTVVLLGIQNDEATDAEVLLSATWVQLRPNGARHWETPLTRLS